MKHDSMAWLRLLASLSLLALVSTSCSAGIEAETELDETRGDERVAQTKSELNSVACSVSIPHGGLSQQTFAVTAGCPLLGPEFVRGTATASHSGAGACSIIGFTSPTDRHNPQVNVAITNAGGFGNGTCVVTVTSLPQVCEVSSTPLSAGSSACTAQICATDPFCCANQWDAICVSEARSKCNSLVCVAPPCAHAECYSGSKLTSSCSASVSAICALDPFCCNSSWDNLCVNEVATLAGKNCNL